AASAFGDLDYTFGTHGRTETGVGHTADILTLADGRILIAGSDGGDFRLTRRLPDAVTYDPTFGYVNSVGIHVYDGAIPIGDPRASNATAAAMAIQPDGRVVVAGSLVEPGAPGGTADSAFVLARFNPDGT